MTTGHIPRRAASNTMSASLVVRRKAFSRAGCTDPSSMLINGHPADSRFEEGRVRLKAYLG